MKRPVRHGASITCDVRGCTEKFVTYSVSSFVRTQAEKEGWAFLPFVFYPTAGRKKIDACPACATELRYNRATDALVASIIRLEKKLQTRLVRENERVKLKVERVSKRAARLILRIQRSMRLTLQRAKRTTRLSVLGNGFLLAETPGEIFQRRDEMATG